jgi:diguanylate cyclase (GGDEF)-like protein
MDIKSIKSRTGMIIDGVAASQCIDSSGEILDIEGVDCAQMEEAGGILLNWEHKDGSEGADTIVGKVTYLKKILSASDCENDRQRMYWDKIKQNPFIYVTCRLFDGSGHKKAEAIAAIIRDNVAHDEPLACRFSIEGSTTSKEGNTLKASIFKRLAITLAPCNKTAISGLLKDNAIDTQKSEDQFVNPEFRRLGGSVELNYNPVVDSQTEASLRLISAATAIRTLRKAISPIKDKVKCPSCEDGESFHYVSRIGFDAKKGYTPPKKPLYMCDSCGDIHEDPDIKKAIEAGSLDGAPSSRTQGAALQREDARNTAKAVLRDYGWGRNFKRSEFRAFSKAKLPEMSDDFLDHFTDIAESYAVKKALQKASSLIKKDTSEVESVQAPEAVPVEAKPKSPKPAGTFRGKKLKPNEGLISSSFDEKKGVLRTPIGNFKAYLPSHDGPEAAENYQKILSHPDIEDAMDHAMTNWSKVHKLTKAGKLPPEVLMHAVLFAQLSPNKPVPTQEIQYARLVDAMNQSGLDPRKPGFEAILPHIKALDSATVPPVTGGQTIATHPAYRQRNDSDVTGRKAGDLLSTSPLLSDGVKNMSQYYKLHDGLLDVMSRHRHNMMGAVSELMDAKTAKTNFDNVNRARAKAGLPPKEGNPVSIPGIKVETGLYTWGMLGGGNSVVPDTHFIRNAFGLDMHKDSDTLSRLKDIMWSPTNMQSIMGPYNRWYQKNHPAMKYTLEHPKWGSIFEKPEDATFPAFWRHWLTIRPHEKFLGMPNLAMQEGTNHAPFWESIAPMLNKADIHDSTVPYRTAMVHQQYVKDFGEIPAMFLYYHHLVPHLLDAARHRESTGRDLQFLAKSRQIEAELIELRKTVDSVISGYAFEPPEVHEVNLSIGGRRHPAGRFMIHNGRLHHLEDYHGVLDAMIPEGDVDTTTISRLHGIKWSPNFRVQRHYHEDPAEPEQIPVEVKPQPLPQRPPVFEYHRPGMARPHTVEFSNGKAALDGRELSDAETKLLLSNADKGLATLRYKSQPTPLNKTEEDLDPEGALQHIRNAVAAGHIHPDVERALTRHIYEDKMTPGLGNKYAYQQFRAKNKPGVYISADSNDFKAINDTYGHDAGDQAIMGVGNALRSAAEKVGTVKLFRPGGDEFVIHAPSYEEASKFMRHATKHLDQVPAVGGVHKHSMSFGLGNDFATADKALYHAKEQKKDPTTGGRMFPVGKTPHMAHSLVPDNAGAIKLHDESPPVQTLPKQAAAPV